MKTPQQQPADDLAGYRTLRSRLTYCAIVTALFAYTQRHDFVAPSDAIIAFTVPLIALNLGVLVGLQLYRTFDTMFRSYGGALLAIVLCSLIQFGCGRLLASLGLRKLLAETLNISVICFAVAAVLPLVNGRRKE